MKALLANILQHLREDDAFSARDVDTLIHKANANAGAAQRPFAKKRLLPEYYRIKNAEPELYASWHVDARLEERLRDVLRMKPRRTASGVATITVITKPWPCACDCRYCPSDVRMPKSYLHDEPACQRAERAFFDPYLQVSTRLKALFEMGHCVDKVELIVLGGTWTDYPVSYRQWFVRELFRALDDDTSRERNALKRRKLYEDAGLSSGDAELSSRVADIQARLDAGEATYAQAHTLLYGPQSPWGRIACWQKADVDDVAREHRRNERAACRCVGLSFETRPDAITPEALVHMRKLGCTKVQVGVQSLSEDVLRRNGRAVALESTRRAFELLRLFGFKIHAHFMVNLLGARPEEDKTAYERFMHEPEWVPDEVKLYPCALIEGTRLCEDYERGLYRPYGHDELVDVLAYAQAHTPPYVRISRMIRDFSSDDIVAGNKLPNLRQVVERELETRDVPIAEIRHREIRAHSVALEDLTLQDVSYETAASVEHFLQWCTPQGAIAGFLRLSLPKRERLAAYEGIATGPDEAMVREVHVYGHVAGIEKAAQNAQHRGLGRQLIEHACEIARQAGYEKLDVISAVGTREYYRKLGFEDAGLYQQRVLSSSKPHMRTSGSSNTPLSANTASCTSDMT